MYVAFCSLNDLQFVTKLVLMVSWTPDSNANLSLTLVEATWTYTSKKTKQEKFLST